KLYFTEIYRTSLAIMALPLQGAPVQISRDEGMASGGVFLDANRDCFGFAWETMNRPPEAFVSKIESFDPQQVSRVQEELPSTPIGKTDVIRWKSKDGMQVEGL